MGGDGGPVYPDVLPRFREDQRGGEPCLLVASPSATATKSDDIKIHHIYIYIYIAPTVHTSVPRRRLSRLLCIAYFGGSAFPAEGRLRQGGQGGAAFYYGAYKSLSLQCL